MLAYLVRHRIIRASLSTKTGKGRRRWFSFADLLVLRTVVQLLEKGVSVTRMKKDFQSIHRFFRSSTESETPLGYLFTDGKKIFRAVNENGGLVSLTDDGQYVFAFVLDLTGVQKHVRTELMMLAQKPIRTSGRRY